MPNIQHRRINRFVVTGLIAASLVVSAACSSSKNDSSSGTSGASSSGSTGTGILGAVKQAGGSTVTIGYITDGKSTSIDFTHLQQTAQAAAKYVNEHLNGIAGHPIELKICETKQVPATAADCAQQMVAASVPAVINDVSGVGGAYVPILAAAGIPYVTFNAASTAELTTKNSYSLTGSVATLYGGVAGYAKQKGYKKVAILAFNVPSVIEPANNLGKKVFTKAGAELLVIPIAPGTADASPQIQQAISFGADAILGIGNSTVCSSILKAEKSLNFTGQKFLNSECIQAAAAPTIPGGYTGVIISATTKQQAGDPEFDLYKAVLEKYSPDTAAKNSSNIGAVQGYGAVLGLARLMAGVTSGDVTAKLISDTIPSAKNVVQPVGGGVKDVCDSNQVPGLPALCSSGSQLTELTQDGAPTTYTTINPADLFK
ncbi:MAG: hypothetical protein JWM76_1813 [Pseudonocardiales bacterium]|nr:hypothetical protein [Pseudonocardiales bacterium]